MVSARLPLDRIQLLVEVHLPTPPATNVVVSLAGELDWETGTEVHRVVVEVLDRHDPERISLDMDRVTFLSSSGITALLRCRRRVQERGAVLEISNAHDIVRQVLAITGLLDVFHVRDAAVDGGDC
ncbi:hypothetical protein KRMM14A1259_71510 [Krasilnikovia sp. MM14-A1259]